MAGPRKVSQEEYDTIRSNLEKNYHYDEMSDEKKAQFDAEIDKAMVVDKKTDSDDDDVVEKGELDDGHPHERDDDDENIR